MLLTSATKTVPSFCHATSKFGPGGRPRRGSIPVTSKSRRLHYSVGVTITEDIAAAIGKVPAAGWTPAYDGDGQVREGAWVADISGLLDLQRPHDPLLVCKANDQAATLRPSESLHGEVRSAGGRGERGPRLLGDAARCLRGGAQVDTGAPSPRVRGTSRPPRAAHSA